tara:strand:+ start:450 stop:572 length:123 start_codon:yes stop_codon:yes gene_type:complete
MKNLPDCFIILGIIIFIVFFKGDPDLHDALIHSLMKEGKQ